MEPKPKFKSEMHGKTFCELWSSYTQDEIREEMAKQAEFDRDPFLATLRAEELEKEKEKFTDTTVPMWAVSLTGKCATRNRLILEMPIKSQKETAKKLGITIDVSAHSMSRMRKNGYVADETLIRHTKSGKTVTLTAKGKYLKQQILNAMKGLSE